jgi:hypothetical protein
MVDFAISQSVSAYRTYYIWSLNGGWRVNSACLRTVLKLIETNGVINTRWVSTSECGWAMCWWVIFETDGASTPFVVHPSWMKRARECIGRASLYFLTCLFPSEKKWRTGKATASLQYESSLSYSYDALYDEMLSRELCNSPCGRIREKETTKSMFEATANSVDELRLRLCAMS